MIASKPLRVGVVCDHREEGWPSMDLVADMLLRTLGEEQPQIAPVEVRPRMRRRFAGTPLGAHAVARNADRLVARFIDYPRFLRSLPHPPRVYHVVDHSYAHLVHALPAERTVVTCHDLDTFRSVLQPDAEPRSWAFRRMTRRILSGLRMAARVTCDSIATRDAILAHGLIPEQRLEVVYLGVDPAMSPEPDPAADRFIDSILGPVTSSGIDLLHVGSTIPRKRLDVLLRTFARVRAERPGTRLVRVGGPLTDVQAALARDLGLDAADIVTMPYLAREQLASVYRRAAVVLQPSEAEGFGLPVVEAMACGASVVASDLAVLREVGGPVATYCPVGDVASWSGTVCAMLRQRRENPSASIERRAAAIAWAGRFSWSRYTSSVTEIYQSLAATPDRPGHQARRSLP